MVILSHLSASMLKVTLSLGDLPLPGGSSKIASSPSLRQMQKAKNSLGGIRGEDSCLTEN